MNFAQHHALVIVMVLVVAMITGIVASTNALAQVSESVTVDNGILDIEVDDVVTPGRTFSISARLEYDLPLQDVALRIKNTRKNKFLENGQVDFFQDFNFITITGVWTDSISADTDYEVYLIGPFNQQRLHKFKVFVDDSESTTGGFGSTRDFGNADTGVVDTEPFFTLTKTFYEFQADEDGFGKVLFDIAEKVEDPDGDTLTYGLFEREGSSASSSACYLEDSSVLCDIFEPGELRYGISVSDEDGNTIGKNFGVRITAGENQKPVLDLPDAESFPIVDESVLVFELAQLAYDPEDTPLTFFIEEVNTFSRGRVASCELADTDVYCTFFGEGTTKYQFKAMDADGQFVYRVVEFSAYIDVDYSTEDPNEDPVDNTAGDGSTPDGNTTQYENTTDQFGDDDTGFTGSDDTNTTDSDEGDYTNTTQTDDSDMTTGTDDSTTTNTSDTTADGRDDVAGDDGTAADNTTDATTDEDKEDTTVADEDKEETNDRGIFGFLNDEEYEEEKEEFFEPIPEETIAEKKERLEEVAERFSKIANQRRQNLIDRQVTEEEIREKLRVDDRIIERVTKDIVVEEVEEVIKEEEIEVIEDLIETRIDQILDSQADELIDIEDDGVEEPEEVIDKVEEEVIEKNKAVAEETNIIRTRKTIDEKKERAQKIVAVKKTLIVEKTEDDPAQESDTIVQNDIPEERSTVVLTITPQQAENDVIEIVEVIPKEIARSVSELSFNVQPIILEDDPIVMWQLEEIEETVELTYTIDKEIEITGNTIALAEEIEPEPVALEEATFWETIRPLLFIPLAVIVVIYIGKRRSPERLKKF